MGVSWRDRIRRHCIEKPKVLRAVNSGKEKEQGQGRRLESEYRKTKHEPTTFHLCSRLCLFISFLSHQMETVFSSRKVKSSKTSGAILFAGMARKSGTEWREYSKCSYLITKWEDLPWGHLQWPEGFSHLDSSITWASVKEEIATSPDFLFLLFSPTRNPNYHSTQISTEFLSFISAEGSTVIHSLTSQGTLGY